MNNFLFQHNRQPAGVFAGGQGDFGNHGKWDGKQHADGAQYPAPENHRHDHDQGGQSQFASNNSRINKISDGNINDKISQEG